MKRLLLIALLLPLLTAAQTPTTKVVNISGVGNINIVNWTPANPVSAKLLTVVQFPGSGESGSDPSKAYAYGPLKLVKAGWQPNDMQFIFAQTPYTWGTYQNPIAGAFVRGVMDYVSHLPNVDPDKIFLTGLSYGADHCFFYMQHEDAAHYVPIAGIVPMSMQVDGSVGAYPNDKLGGNDLRFNKTAIYAICGDADPFKYRMDHFYALTQDPVKNSADPNNLVKVNMKYDIIKGAHNGEWNLGYDNAGVHKLDGSIDTSIYDWMRSIVAASAPVVAPPIVVPPPAKTIVSVTTTYTYSDGTKETITRP